MDAENKEWQEPPLPEQIRKVDEPPQMSEAATLGSIFIEPGRTFEDLRRKPRFIMASLIIILAVTAFNAIFIQKVGFERLVRERIESNSRVQQLPADQKEKVIEQQSGSIAKGISYVAPPIVFAIIILLGGLLYWLGANAMGGNAGFLHGLSVWAYSSLPPTVLFMIANLIVLMLKSVDEIDFAHAQNGLVQANPSMFIDAKAMPALAAVLSAFDLFGIWGWVLAAIGLQKVAKISSGAAWAVVLLLGLVGVALKVLLALVFG
jgi:hypothetical protein